MNKNDVKKDIKKCVNIFIDYNPVNKTINDINKIKEVINAYEKRNK